MAYVPPSFREKKSDKEISIENAALLVEKPDTHFPALGASTFIRPKNEIGGSYASKASEWKKQREEIEMKERIQAELAIEEEEKRKRQAEEDDYIAGTIGLRKRNENVVETVVTVEAPVSEWTTVTRKARKIRKDKVDFNEVPEVMEYEEVGYESG